MHSHTKNALKKNYSVFNTNKETQEEYLNTLNDEFLTDELSRNKYNQENDYLLSTDSQLKQRTQDSRGMDFNPNLNL